MKTLQERKKCKGPCKGAKYLSEFPKNSMMKDGLNSRCKACFNLWQRDYRAGVSQAEKESKKEREIRSLPPGAQVFINGVPYKIGARDRSFRLSHGEWVLSSKPASEVQTEIDQLHGGVK